MKLRVTEYLDLDLEKEWWCCHNCGRYLIEAGRNYKEGCLVYDRDPREVHRPIVDAPYNFAPDPEWVRILEFYCPGCGTQVEVESLPPGHPITHDIEIDVPRLKQRLAEGELVLEDGRLKSRL